MGRVRTVSGVTKEPVKGGISRQDKKELRTLADDLAFYTGKKYKGLLKARIQHKRDS